MLPFQQINKIIKAKKMAQELMLNMNSFKKRFTESQRVDDLFNRGFILCMDHSTNRRALLKHYSTQTQESSQAVLQNIQNFAKLNQIQGICQILAFSKLEGELAAVFQFDEKTVGEIIAEASSTEPQTRQSLKNSIMGGKKNRIEFYVQLISELTKIITMTNQVGIELDDLNRDTIVIENPPIISSSSINLSPALKVKVLYDERDREYENLLENNTTLKNGNKLYWSADKIYSQVFQGQQYQSNQCEQSIYQLGLLMLDIIFQCENVRQLTDTQAVNQNSHNQLLEPDQIVINNSEKRKGYYNINKNNFTVQRDDVFMAYKLNYLINSEHKIMKQLGILIKKMICVNPDDRPALDVLTKEIHSIQMQMKKQIGSLTSFSSGEISMGSRLSSEDIIIDSLKYSENSLSQNQDFKSIRQEGFGKKQIYQNPSANNLKKQPHMPLSATTITSQAASLQQGLLLHNQQNGHLSHNPSIVPQRIEEKIASLSGSRLINESHLFTFCQNSHPDEKEQLRRTINELNEMFQRDKQIIGRKQYFDGSVYYGCISNSQKRSGLGIYQYKVGDIYFGNWEQNLLINGIYLFKNGQSFRGNVRNGKQGKGIYRYANGNIYEGQWKDDLKNGKGTMIYPSGAKYVGDWVKGKKHGSGIYYYENGLRFQGAFALGKKYGEGHFIFQNGTKVVGFWDNNHLQGKAKIFYHNGDYYEGNVHMSQKNGEGMYKWNSEQGEIEYKGQFKKDSLQGFAVIKFKTGQIYEGKVRHGKRDGQGTYQYRNGDEFRGQWKNDQKVMGKYVFQSGQIFQGKFKDGQISFGTFTYCNGQIYQGQFMNGERHGVGTYADKLGKIVFEGHWQRDEFIKAR